jgi:hypothetical protein
MKRYTECTTVAKEEKKMGNLHALYSTRRISFLLVVVVEENEDEEVLIVSVFVRAVSAPHMDSDRLEKPFSIRTDGFVVVVRVVGLALAVFGDGGGGGTHGFVSNRFIILSSIYAETTGIHIVIYVTIAGKINR